MTEYMEINEGLNEQHCIPVTTAIRLVQLMLEDIKDGELADVEAVLGEINHLVNRVITQNAQDADADDWHNFAVEVARSDLYDLSCDILECGLKHSKNIDLLADFLQYGMSCGRFDRCKEIYKTLQKIPKIRWNWRAYSFSINYLLFLWDSCETEKEINRISSDMLSLTEDFHKYLPNEEEAYKCEAEVKRTLLRFEEEEAALRNGIETITVSPKCCLRLATLLINRGDFEEALALIQRCKDTLQTQSSINEGYLFYLSGLCKIAIRKKASDGYSEKDIMDIYKDFNISLKQNYRADYRKNIRAKAIVLEEESKVLVPDAYEELKACLEMSFR